MPRRLLLLMLCAFLFASSGFAYQRGSGSSRSSSRSHSSGKSSSKTVHVRSYTRNSRGRIKRSAAAKDAFERKTGYPHGRPGYVVDHVKPLACGGADDPSNMQWQTIAEGKAKDKTERVGCR